MLFLAEFLSGNGKKEEKYFEIISMNRTSSLFILFILFFNGSNFGGGLSQRGEKSDHGIE